MVVRYPSLAKCQYFEVFVVVNIMIFIHLTIYGVIHSHGRVILGRIEGGSHLFSPKVVKLANLKSKKEQAGAELCQALDKIELPKKGWSLNLINVSRS